MRNANFISAQTEIMNDADIYKLVYEIVTEAMIVADRSGIIIQANPAAVQLFEYPMDEIVGMNVDNLLPDALKKIHKQHREHYIKDPQRRSMGAGLDLQAQTGSGKLIPVEISLNHAKANGELHVVALISDISARKEAEARILQINKELELGVRERTKALDSAVNALEESQHLYTLIAQNFPDGTINVLDKEFNYVFAEGTDFVQEGIDRSRLIGQNYISFLPDEKQEEFENELNRVLKGQQRTFEIVTSDKTFILSAVPLYDGANEVNRILVVEKNISEQKLAEEDMVAALKKERELNELKSRFVSMASHEFRTPLATILSSVNLVKRHYESNNADGITKHIGRIRNSVRNLTSILNDFLSLEKLEQGKVEFQPQLFSIGQLARSVSEEMGEMTKQGQNIQLNFKGGKMDGLNEEIGGLDPQLVRNILFNLLSNAIKYSSENSQIFLDIEVSENLILSVKDSGIGIPKNEVDHLFERFFRAKNATNIQGTGLGLNIVQKHVNLMGGHIDFTSEVNKGTTFNITLPIDK